LLWAQQGHGHGAMIITKCLIRSVRLLLVGGVFGVLLKSLQYSQVFKTELSKIIYGKEEIENSCDLVTTFRTELRSMIYGAEEKIARSDVIKRSSKRLEGLSTKTRPCNNGKT
jgi:hypothetical protein